MFGETIFLLIALFVLSRTLFKHSFSYLNVIKNHLVFVGRSEVAIKKDDIQEISLVSWDISKLTKTWGVSFLFFKPLVCLRLTNTKTIYIRSSNAKELQDDLTKWKDETN